MKQALLAADICPGLATASFEEFAVVDDVPVVTAAAGTGSVSEADLDTDKNPTGIDSSDSRSLHISYGADSVGELVGALEALAIPGGHEIVLVNDGSPDNSLAVCRDLVARARIPITLIDLARNYGEHNAVMTGLRHARGAVI